MEISTNLVVVVFELFVNFQVLLCLLPMNLHLENILMSCIPFKLFNKLCLKCSLIYLYKTCRNEGCTQLQCTSFHLLLLHFSHHNTPWAVPTHTHLTIFRILHNLWINNVPVLKPEVMEHRTARNNIRHKGRADFQGLEEDEAPVCLQHPEGSLHNVACTSMLGVEASLYRILYKLSIWCDEADGRAQTRIPNISKDAFSCRWIQAASVNGAVLQHPSIVHRPGVTNKDLEELSLVVSDGLQLDRVEQLPVKIACGVTCRWLDPDVTAI